MKYYLGIDVGTGACKAVAFDQDGRPAASSFREYAVTSPRTGWAELNTRDVLDKCMQTIADCARQLPRAIAALAVSCQGEAFAPVDGACVPLGPAMVSSDSRAGAYARHWAGQFGLERLYRTTGHTPAGLFTLFKLLWMRDNQGDLWRRAARFLCFEDLLQARLGVEPAMSWSLAGRTMLFDVRKHQWSPEILSAIGLDSRRLARTTPSGRVIGRVPSGLSSELGLADGAVVVSAGHDQPCGALGAGVVEDALAVYATGTVECITAAFSSPVFSDDLRNNNLCTYDHVVEGMYVTLAYSLTGGNILRWFRDQLGQVEVERARATGRNIYELLLESLDDRPAAAITLPYFTPTGTPYFDADITGAIMGLRMSTTRGEILRSLLEGVAMEMRLNLAILERSNCLVRQLRAIGGGAKSAAWNQLKADVIGKPLSVVNVSEAGCLGAAMLARAAIESENVLDLTTRWVSIRSEHKPRPELCDWYDRRFDLYQSLYPQLSRLLSCPQLKGP